MSYRVWVASVITVALMASPALADAIAGNWCPPGGGRVLQVRNFDDVMFAGKVVKANVDRHHVDFVVPEGERDTGLRFNADQLNDEQIRVTIGSKASQVWTPCQPIS